MKLAALFVVLLGCTSATDDPASTVDRIKRDAGHPDAPIDTAPPADAHGAAGWAICLNSGDPNAMVNLATDFCCFDEIDAPNWGWPEPNAGAFGNCVRSWDACDGNEDCAAGTTCTAHLQESTLYPPALIFAIECRASLGAGDRQMCHGLGDPECPAGTTCVKGESDAVGWYGMPSNMYVCN